MRIIIVIVIVFHHYFHLFISFWQYYHYHATCADLMLAVDALELRAPQPVRHGYKAIVIQADQPVTAKELSPAHKLPPSQAIYRHMQLHTVRL